MLDTLSPIFPGRLIEAVRKIRENYATSSYDHRQHLPACLPLSEEYYTEQFRVGYACFKREVAMALDPRRILEIGIGIGVSTLAFMDACPRAVYIGIDNDSETKFSVQPTDFVGRQLTRMGCDFKIMRMDSQKMTSFPSADLIHIDGCHDYFATVHDMLLAWDTDASWILIDDCRDSTVAAAVLWVVHQKRPGSFEWTYFEDTLTGSILVSREVGRP